MRRSAAVGAIALVGLLPGCGGSRSGPPLAVPSTTAATATTTTTPPPPPISVDPGTLPQTGDRPPATSPALAARIGLLVDAVRDGVPAEALPAFFPRAAYLQVKAVPDPGADWSGRLVSQFDADIVALHRSLGAAATSLTVEGFDVPDAAVWVRPGAEVNRIGYWRVYGTTVHDRVSGVPGSFVVISMISWRGEWYVVHFRTAPR